MNKIKLRLGINGDMKILDDDQDKMYLDFKLTQAGDRYENGLISLSIVNKSKVDHKVDIKIENSLSNTVEPVGNVEIKAGEEVKVPVIDVTHYYSSAYTELSKSGIDIIGINVLVLDFDDGNDIKRIQFNERQLLKDFDIVPNK